MENKFVVEQKTLLSILSSMQPICTKRTAIDETSFILFQIGNRELVLKSTDMEVSLQASCLLLESSFIQSESFLVPGKRIFDVLKELDGLVTFALTNNFLSIKCDGVNLALNIKDAQEFPPFPERIENLMHISSADLKNMLESVAFLIPQNNANNALNGLLLEISDNQMSMTSTDGHCLSRVSTNKYQLSESKSWLIPRRAIFELKKILETTTDNSVFLGVCSRQLVFSGEMFNFFTKLLVDQFPNYMPILEKNGFIAATVDRPKFIKTLKRSACLLSGQFLATKFVFNQEILQVSMNNKEVGQLDEELPISGNNQLSLDARFYAPYLLNGLQAFNEGNATFYIKDSNRPIIFESQGSDFTTIYLVMPVSAQNMR